VRGQPRHDVEGGGTVGFKEPLGFGLGEVDDGLEVTIGFRSIGLSGCRRLWR
jgi:hypothetical protein